MFLYVKSVSLTALCCTLLCSCSVLNTKDSQTHESRYGTTALYNANFMLMDHNQSYCLSFDYDLILSDAANFIRHTDYLNTLSYVVDEADNKAFIYRALLQKYNIKVAPYESDDINAAYITFRENDTKTELFMLIHTPYGSINRLYGKNSHQTFALSAFNIDASAQEMA